MLLRIVELYTQLSIVHVLPGVHALLILSIKNDISILFERTKGGRPKIIA